MSAATTVQIMGPTTVVRGSMNVYELIITNSAGSQTGAGLDVAASAGTLGTSAMAPLTQMTAGEITHRSVIARSTPTTWRIPFTWTAPAMAGSARINAAGNAVNQSAGQIGDQWNTGSLAITVTDTMMADSGVETDSGVAPRDSGVAEDSGVRMGDSGVAEDTGVAPMDDAASQPDAPAPSSDGSTARDAGTTPADGGMGMQMPGCACRTTSARTDPKLALLTVAGLALAVRSRRRRTSAR
jgi:MYXO-CTERM domain-containing protein